ncbi:MAG: class I SAM-dependent methyltransferase [Candidatus Eisenbacteria bacterium]|uniref:Class I SAM-dependent methyltransferase n=1 Tax=Eiseniibacteriota bacterium TaxID=2212470 RepID=A0A849SFK2_UNCEI|nr:class I SAM-dependent methyltransferase [Candidatus Eisenbacteria bacterium]
MRETLRADGRRARVLVIGGGTRGGGTDAIYEAPDLDVIAFDIYASRWCQFIADAHSIPLESRTIDAVWVQAVLEHVLDPWQVVAEIERVLRPNGLVYAETPFLQQVHEGAYDFTRFTESGQRWLFRRFERLDSGLIAGPGIQFAWSIEHLVRALTRSRMVGRLARLGLFWVQWLDGVTGRSQSLDGASCTYFFGRLSERSISPRDMVRHYANVRANSPNHPDETGPRR